MKRAFTSASPPALRAASQVPWLLGSGWRPMALVLVALAVPMGLFALLIVEQVRQSVDERARYFNHATAHLAGQIVEERFQGSARYIESYASRPAVRRAVSASDGAALSAQLEDMVQGNPGIDRAVLTTPDGRLFADFPPRPALRNRDFSFRDWYQGVRQTRATHISGLYLRSAAPQHYTVAIASPVYNDQRVVVGYLVGQHTVHTLATWLNTLTPSLHGRVLLADPHGRLALPPGGQTPSLQTLEGHSLGERVSEGRHWAGESTDPLSNRRSLVEVAPTVAGWSVVVSQPLSDTHALLRTLNQTVASLAIVFAGGMATLGLFWLSTVRRYQEERQAAAHDLEQRASDLETAYTELQESDRYKDQFLSILSHELRTPLNGVTGFASILQDELSGPLNDEQHQQVQKIIESGERMIGMVNNLLEMSRIQAGAFSLSPGWTSVTGLAQGVHEMMLPRAADAGIQLDVLVEGEHERCLDGDRMRLALVNLVDNAIKFTPRGGHVQIRTRVAQEALVVEVADTGVGLHRADAERIFERFRQADMSATRSVGGTGLGLAIAKAIIDAHGGQIGVRSTPGRGATFWLTVPPMAGCPEL